MIQVTLHRHYVVGAVLALLVAGAACAVAVAGAGRGVGGGATPSLPSLSASSDPLPDMTVMASVGVVEFNSVIDLGPYDWIGSGLQQVIITELGNGPATSAFELNFPNRKIAVMVTGARAVGVNFMVFGTVQVSDERLLITAVVYDVNTPRPLAGLKVQGKLSEVFELQQQMALQVRQTITAARRIERPADEASFSLQ